MVAIFGISSGWMADGVWLKERLRQSEVENSVEQDQLEVLKQQFSMRYGTAQINYWLANAVEFVKMLMTASDDESLLVMAPSPAGAEDEVLQESANKLTALLNASEERTRFRLLIALWSMQNLTPNRMTKRVPSIMTELVPVLDNSSTRIVGETFATLGAFGLASRDAIVPLSKRMSDDSDW